MKQIFAWDRRQVGAGILGSVACTFVTSLFQNSMTWESVSILVGVALVSAVAGLAVADRVMGKPEPQTPDPPESPVATAEPVNREPEKRIYTQRTAAEIFAAIENMTELQIERFVQPHIGKWIRVQSVVRDISQKGGFFYVMLGKRFDPVLYLAFEKARCPSIETMVKGDRIAAEGQIHTIENMTLYLDRCELVELGEKDDILRQV